MVAGAAHQIRFPVRLSWLIPVLALVGGGCAESSLSANQQACMECAIRAHSDPEAARMAARDLARQCEAGAHRSCSVLGVMYEHGRGVARRPDHAERLYRAACVGGNTTGCVNLGRLLQEGTAGRVDPEGAAAVFEVACSLDHADGCYELARIRYTRGDGEGAAEALGRSCAQHHADACHGLGAMHEHGHGVPRDLATARRYFTQACARGHADACRRAAVRELATR
jgi:uncharacterized protein